MKDKIIIDLDNTITIDEENTDYPYKKLNSKVQTAITNAQESGFDITIFSSRNMRTYKGDVSKIEKFTRPVAESWLAKNGVKYDSLILGKPWSGKEGFYVDDKNLSIEEFIFKFSSSSCFEKVSLIVSFFNEEKNIIEMHKKNLKAERFFNIIEYVYVDNGSKDNTLSILNELARNDKKIKIVSLNDNFGYGAGYKAGLEASLGELIILNHADMQFDLYNYILTNYDTFFDYNVENSFFPQRLNRSFAENFSSSLLRLFISIIWSYKIKDFNGQPKIFYKSKISKISELPSNYCFDLALYKKLENKVFLPIIQNERNHGISSWSGSILKRIKIFVMYIYWAVKNR